MGRARPRRWVNAEIDRLDPEVDYEKIVSLVTQYQQNEFVVNLGYVVSFHTITLPIGGTTTIAGTGKARDFKQTRFFDTAEFIVTWVAYGPSDQRVKDSVTRLNRMHANLFEKYPGAFDRNIDFVFTLAQQSVFGDRMRDMVGAPRLPRTVQIAMHHVFRDLSHLFTSEAGQVHDFPQTYEESLRLVEDYVNSDFGPPTPTGREVSDVMIAQFNEKYLPRPLWPLGRAVVLAFVPEAAQRRHDVQRANPALVWLARKTFRTLFFLQDHVLPDNRIPMIDEMGTDRYHQRRSFWKKKERTAARVGV